MKTVKREKLLILALMFGLSCGVAKAEEKPTWGEWLGLDAPRKVEVTPVLAKVAEPEPVKVTEETQPPTYVNLKSGLNDAELRSIAPDLEIYKDGDIVEFTGLVPARCAEDARVDYAFKDKVHAITVSMPKCAGDKAVAKPGESLVALSGFLKKVKLKPESGKVVLRHYKAGDAASRSRVQDEDMKDKDGKPLSHKGDAELEFDKAELAKREAAKKDLVRLEDLERKVEKACKADDIESLSTALLEAKDLLGNVTTMIEKKKSDQLAKLKKDLAAADSVEKANEILEAYKVLANDLGEHREGNTNF